MFSSPIRCKRWNTRPNRAGLLGVLLCLVLTSGCSSDSGSGGFVPTCIVFSPSSDPVAGTVVAQAGEDTTCDVLEMELIVTGVNDIFGTSFTVNYPVAISQWIGLVDLQESLLARDGVDLIVVAQETQPGEVTVALSRDGSQTEVGVDADVDNNVLVRLLFLAVSDGGPDDVAFVNADLSAPGQPPVPKGIAFQGGTIAVQ